MGVKKNIIYTTILTSSNYIFPLIVYPYVSRVLGVHNIGLCNFIDSVIDYFILISMMGVNIVGTRLIAADQSKKEKLNQTFSSLLTLNGLFTALALLFLCIATLLVPDLSENREMMGYGALKVVSNFLLLEWLFRGLEDFKFITYRSLLVKCLYVVAIFIFVRERTDYSTYYLLTVLTLTGNAVVNVWFSKRFVDFKRKLINFKYIWKPFLILGGYLILTSLYTKFNIVFLGFTTDDAQVGYYTTATKLYSIFLAVFSGVSTVLMPRMSSLLAEKKIDEFKVMIYKSINYLLSLSFPVIILTVIFSPQVIYLISGPGYEGAATPMRIIMPLMLIIGYEQIQVIQCLMPLGSDKIIMRNSIIGAVVGVVFNLLFVPMLKSVGAAITWVIAELIILYLSQIALKHKLGMKFPFKDLLNFILYYTPLAGILIILYYFSIDLEYWVSLILAAATTAIYFLILQIFILKDPIFKTILSKIKS